MTQVANLFIAGTLVLAVAVQFFKLGEDEANSQQNAGQHLLNELPKKLENWNTKEMKLGPSESVSDAARETLNMDHYVNRLFSKNGTNFTIYAAYWSPERMPVQLVASHTPDRCWTENGWTCTRRKADVTVNQSVANLKPAQYREFQQSGETRYVYYWHLVGDKLYDYGEGDAAIPNPLTWIKGALKDYFVGSQAQLFIRVDANRPFDELNKMNGFQNVLSSLEQLGLKSPQQ